MTYGRQLIKLHIDGSHSVALKPTFEKSVMLDVLLTVRAMCDFT